MDFWDLAKLMWRRWYVTVPMLVVTAVGAVYIAITVGPEYQATGHVSIVFPTTQRQSDDEVTRVNPFDEVALIDAAQIRLEGKPLKDELAAAGFEGEYAVEVDSSGRTILIEVVAPTTEQGLDTLHKLQEVAEEEVALRQDEYNVREGDRFNTVVYDQGESVETTSSSMRRALVAVVGAGLILTVALAALFDALARWRARSRQPQPAAAPSAVAAAAGPAIAGSPDAVRSAAPTSVVPASPAASRPISGPPAGGPVRPRYTYSTAARASASVPPAASNGATSFEEELPVAGQPPEHGDKPRDDSTIVIPLASTSWPRKANGERPNGADNPDRSAGAGEH